MGIVKTGILLSTTLLLLVLIGCIENGSNTIGKAFGGVSNEPFPYGNLLNSSPTHLECRNNQCTRVPGTAPDRCVASPWGCIDQNIQQTHYECRNNTCTPVNGPGQNQCQPNTQSCITCIEYQTCHMECRNNSCVQVEGVGTNQCSSNANCTTAAPDFNLQSINEGHMNESGAGAISFTVKNVGTANYQGTLKHLGILYKMDSNPVQVISTITWDASSDNYAIGNSFTYTQSADLPNGYYKFQAIADSNENVNELNEGNNKKNYYFTIDDANAELCNSVPNENQTYSSYLNSSPDAEPEFTSALSLPPKGFSDPLQNCYYYSQGGPIALLHLEQTVKVLSNAAMFANLHSIKDLAANVYPTDYKYVVQFQTPIPANLDFNHGDYAVIPFLGERYKITDMTNQYGAVNKIKLQNMNDYNDAFWIANGWEFPYDGNGQNMLWVTSFLFEGSALKGISIKNNLQYWYPLYSPDSFYGQAQPAMLLQNSGSPKTGFAKAWFEGFGDGMGNQETRVPLEFKKGTNVADMNGVLSSYGALQYNEHSIPMAFLLTTATISHTFWFDGTKQCYQTDSMVNPTRFVIKYSNCNFSSNPDYNILVATTDTDYDYSHVAQLLGKNGKQYKYFVRRGNNSSGLWLVLAGYSHYPEGDINFGGYIDTVTTSDHSAVGDLFLLGTVTNENRLYPPINKAEFNNNDPNSLYRSIYYPDIYDYNGTNSGTSTGVYRTAVFRLRENLGEGYPHPYTPDDNETNSFEIYIDTENGNSGTIDTLAIGAGTKPNWGGNIFSTLVYAHENSSRLTHLSEYLPLPGQSSSNYKKAYTDNGSKVELENRELTIQLPSDRLNVYLRIAVEPPPAVEQWPPQHAER